MSLRFAGWRGGRAGSGALGFGGFCVSKASFLLTIVLLYWVVHLTEAGAPSLSPQCGSDEWDLASTCLLLQLWF